MFIVLTTQGSKDVGTDIPSPAIRAITANPVKAIEVVRSLQKDEKSIVMGVSVLDLEPDMVHHLRV